MLRVVVVRVVIGVIWERTFHEPQKGVLEVFTVVVLVHVMGCLTLGLARTEEMERFVLSGVRVVRFLQMQIK
tara:strand:+ start:597 stop:812 length:216 start_codon:yes stop_codon:yes gene_type:complete